MSQIAAVWTFASESSPGKTYQTLQYTDGTLSCNCPGWTFKRKTTAAGARTCRHTREVESGTASRHALTVVEYGVKGKRTPQQAVPVVPDALPKSFDGNTLDFAPRRKFDFSL